MPMSFELDAACSWHISKVRRLEVGRNVRCKMSTVEFCLKSLNFFLPWPIGHVCEFANSGDGNFIQCNIHTIRVQCHVLWHLKIRNMAYETPVFLTYCGNRLSPESFDVCAVGKCFCFSSGFCEDVSAPFLCTLYLYPYKMITQLLKVNL